MRSIASLFTLLTMTLVLAPTVLVAALFGVKEKAGSIYERCMRVVSRCNLVDRKVDLLDGQLDVRGCPHRPLEQENSHLSLVSPDPVSPELLLRTCALWDAAPPKRRGKFATVAPSAHGRNQKCCWPQA